MTCFDEEPEHQPTKEEWEAYEAKKAEIVAMYAGAPPDEAFEAFDAAGVDNSTVAIVLGQEVAHEYASWIYANVK